MKTLCLLLFFAATFFISNAQDSDLIGTWNIIEFEVISGEEREKMSEEQLKGEGAVWDLFIMEDGLFKQTSNMSGTGTMDSQEGTWESAGDQLTFHLQINSQYFDLVYSYELDKDVLVLKRGNPTGTMKIVSSFRKK